MTERKLYGATFGPYLYDDEDVINDPDGDFANFVEHASVSDGGHICAFVEFLDTDQSHGLKVYWNENDTGHRELALLVVGGNRSFTLNENFVIADGYDVTIQALGQANQFTMNEGFTIGDGYAGTLTYSAATKTLTVEDISIVSQDYTSDASPTFATVKLTNLSDGKIPKHTSDAVGLEDSILSISGSVLVIAGTVACSDLTDGYVPYHVSDAAGLADSLIKIVGGATYVSGTLNVQTGAVTHIQIAPTSNWITVGVEDTEAGQIRLYGQATTSDVGGQIILDFAADHDSLASGFTIRSYQDDLYFGITGGDTDMLKLTYEGDLYVTAGTISCSDLTTGYVPYQAAAGLANAPIYTNGANVGIGSTNLDDKLHVYGGSNTRIRVEANTDGSVAYVLRRNKSGGSYNVIWYMYVATNETVLTWYDTAIRMRLYNDSCLSVGYAGTRSGFMSSGYGITISQGGVDGEVLCFQSTDVTQPFTTIADTNTYGCFQKTSPTLGGLHIRTFVEGDTVSEWHSVYCGATDPTDTATYAAVRYDVAKNNGAGAETYYGDNEFLFCIRNYDAEKFSLTGNGRASIAGSLIVGTISTVSPSGVLEVEDGGTSASMLVKITQDDANVYGLIIGNDTYSGTDTDGLAFKVDDVGRTYVKHAAKMQQLTGSKVLSDGVATGFVSFPVGTDEMVGGHIEYSIYVTDGTDQQAHVGHLTFVAVDKDGTITVDIDEVYLAASETGVATAGTLTDAWTLTDAAGVVTINCNANTSLAGATITLYYTIRVHSTNALTAL